MSNLSDHHHGDEVLLNLHMVPSHLLKYIMLTEYVINTIANYHQSKWQTSRMDNWLIMLMKIPFYESKPAAA